MTSLHHTHIKNVSMPGYKGGGQAANIQHACTTATQPMVFLFLITCVQHAQCAYPACKAVVCTLLRTLRVFKPQRAHRHIGEVSGMQRSSAMHSVQGERGSTGVATPDEPARKETSPSAATGSDIASKPVASSEDSGTEQLPEKLTTWSYGKTKDPGLVTYYLVVAFAVPLLLIIIPFLPFNR
ncbi:hypothetical protein HaLaN_27734, partial [Haematococcus lacustris]